jgi:hypothetical protein
MNLQEAKVCSVATTKRDPPRIDVDSRLRGNDKRRCSIDKQTPPT